MFRSVTFGSMVVCLLIFSACSEYSKVMKSTDLNYKYDKAMEFYASEDYLKAYPILEELIIIYRGTAKSEKLQYTYAFCDYKLGDLVLASHRFKKFANTYPNSTYAEECLFMSAYCLFKNSPKYSLDQTNTQRAIRELQLFVDTHDKSDYEDTCNVIIELLWNKLEEKSYRISKQYYHTRRYESAIVSFGNTLNDYPDTQYAEEMNFLRLKSHFLLANKSVSSKKVQRIQDTIDTYIKFVDSFPTSGYIKEAESMYDSAVKEKSKIMKQNS